MTNIGEQENPEDNKDTEDTNDNEFEKKDEKESSGENGDDLGLEQEETKELSEDTLGDEELDDEMKNREIVVPGEIVAQRDDDNIAGYGTFVDDNKNIISLFVGFLQKRGKYLNIVPFKGRYIPRIGDKVIGKIVDKNVVLYKLDINCPYIAILRASEDADPEEMRDFGHSKRFPQKRRSKSRRMETNQYNIGDLIIAKVLKFDRTTEPSLTTVGPDLGIIKGGFITEIAVPKIPRLIGKNGSMIKLLNNLTSCKIFVAQNGIVWIKGKRPKNERVVMKAVHMIESEAHTFGLTDRVKEFIENELAK
ncbi:MAG: exosome complex RNA-binding protein Rrp4 [Promethearchaeota archaeon]